MLFVLPVGESQKFRIALRRFCFRRSAMGSAKNSAATMTQPKNHRSTRNSNMLGWALDTWDTIAYWTLLIGAILGGIGVALTAFSSWVTMKTSSIIQTQADQKIAEAKSHGEKAHEQAKAAQLEQEKIKNENLQLSINLEK
jgi:hypothetical protein